MKASGKILPTLLLLLILIVSVILLFLNEQLKSERENNRNISRRIAEAQQDPSSEEQKIQTEEWYNFINREKPKFYDASVDDEIYSLGQELSRSIKRHSLQIDFYNIYEKEEKKFFNYTLSGTPENCFRLIRTLSRSEKYFEINSISIEKNGETCSMNILFAPAVLPEPDESQTAEAVVLPSILSEDGAAYSASPRYIASRLFYTPIPFVPVETEDAVEPAPQKDDPIKNAPYWLSYIGHSVEEGIERYYFLDTRTNKTIEIIPGREENSFEITDYLDNGFQINLSGESYYVNKY